LYSPKDNYKTNRLLVMARLCKQSVTHIVTDFTIVKDYDFMKYYPMAQLPALEIEG
jgi:hypothetical protein